MFALLLSGTFSALNPTVPDFTPRFMSAEKKLSAYINTYQEFVPASEAHKKELPVSESRPDDQDKK